jgi:VCBS repeat-containing protein
MAFMSGISLPFLMLNYRLRHVGTNTYLTTLLNLTNNMKQDPKNLSGIVTVWNDWASQGNDGIQKTFTNKINVLSAHVNQSPIGAPSTKLPEVQHNTSYVLSQSQLLAGISDPENNTLSIASISSDNGVQITDNKNGTWTVTPSLDGPHEISYTVTDGVPIDTGVAGAPTPNGTLGATIMLVVQPSSTPSMTLDAQPITTYTDTIAYDTVLLTAAGTLTVSNPAVGSSLTFGIGGITPVGGFADMIGAYGTLSVNTLTGGYTYIPDPVALNALTASATLVHDNFVFTVSDGVATATQNYTVDLTGANDALLVDPVLLTVADTPAYDTFLPLPGFINATSVDGSSLPATFGIVGGVSDGFGGIVLNSAYGTLTVDSFSGAYTYAPKDAAVNALPGGANPTDTFILTVTDTNGVTTTQDFTVNVTGANDPTSFSGATTNLVTENGTLTSGGTLIVSDSDTGEAAITPQTSISGVYGTFTIGSSGAWSYSLNNSAANVKALNTGDIRTDTFAVVTAGGISQNIVVSINGANELFNGGGGIDTLSGTPYGDIISGFAGADTLYGLAGDDTLDGGAGIDTMVGGDGNDTYIVDNSIDVVTETSALAAGGIDLVKASVTYALANNVENLLLTGTGSINGTGNALNNIITGNSGNNTLEGKAGTDTLDGGDGSDVYLFNAASDHPAAEITDTGLSGIDDVRFAATTASTLTLYAGDTGIERVVLGTLTTMNVALNANASLVANPLSVYGNYAANILVGTGFNDTLSGGKGADTLTGGAGMDTFLFNAGDSGLTTNLSNVISNFDKITDYAKGSVGTGDVIDYSSTLTIGGSPAAATDTQALINGTTGVASFAALSGTTLDDALADIATRFSAATDTQGECAFFNIGGAGDTYMFISDGLAGLTTNDVVIQLAGVTSISQINLTNGNLTLIA